ncbi:MAG: BtpA/SgcQ family protein [Deltaproteobacteria bacterium]|nr:BtpA/SgcQ family protein [Deltaproteobacteria bacterium]
MASEHRDLPRLIGVIHLPPLPGSARGGGDFAAVLEAATRDAKALASAGFDGLMVENYGDAPFTRGAVGPETVAAMTAVAARVRAVAPKLPLGVNVLRNDARAALAVAMASGASMVRINVHVGARVTDQGLIEGDAHATLRYRRSLGAERIRLLCDVAVKHSAALAPRPIGEEAQELVVRGLADAVLVTGSGTGAAVDGGELDEVASALSRAEHGAPIFLASGVTLSNLASYRSAYGAIVGTALRRSGHAGDPVDPALARAFASAWKKSRRAR